MDKEGIIGIEDITLVWVFDYMGLEPMLELLSDDERQRSATFKYNDLKEKYVIRTAQLRRTLGNEVNKSPGDLVFIKNKYGKPFLRDEPQVFFNMSHSKEKFAIAISKRVEIGVDIELVNSRIQVEELSTRFFSTLENDRLLSKPDQMRVEIFFNIWTRKEAFIKCIGQGLSFGLDNFAIEHADVERPKVLITNWDTDEKEMWDIRANQTADYKLAVAAKGKLGRVIWIGI